MLTRCPDCATRYRVGPQHLQAAAGRVRCGRCGRVFDAQEHQIEGAALAGPTAVVPAAPPLPETAMGPAPRPASGRRRGGSLWWALGSLLLTGSLVLQLAWWERNTLAADPKLLHLLLPLCRYLSCALHPPRDPAHIEVLSRSLEPDPGRPEVLHFRLRMVNRSSHAQPFPLLQLRLLDAAEKTVGLRRFTPDQYLPSGADADQPMMPGQAVDARLDLLDLKARMQGFQIDFL